MKSFYLFNSRIVSHIAFWLVVLFIFTFFPSLYRGSFLSVLKTNLFYLPQDIFVVYFVLYFLFPKYLTKLKLFKFLVLSSVVLLLLTFGTVLITYYIFPYTNLVHPANSIREQFSNGLFILLTITGMAATIKYVRLSLINQYKTAHITMKQFETELKYLRSQINPHFLFNSLNNIDELVYENPEKASKAIFYLSEILRYVLKESDAKTVEVQKEIDFIKNYIYFARFSFKDQGFIKYSIHGYDCERQIPSMLFIPIIENAVKYVDRKSKSPGITIEITFADDFLEMECKNHFTKFPEFENQNGTGLKNLKRRLELIYPDKHTLEVSAVVNEFMVKLKILES